MHEVRPIGDVLNQIRRGEILLPEFQRGYVWSKDQVRGLVQSLYRKHPTGHLLVWRTYKPTMVRGEGGAADGHSLMLLDGQQRLTSLYVLFEGKAPPFYEGESLFFDLHFNVQTEEFRFWQKTLMQNNPSWISVHEFVKEGLNGLLERLESLDVDEREVLQQNLSRLSKLDQVRDYTYTVDQVSGEDFSVEEVVDIFNRVNKAGTPLTKADLALAHICSIWPEARAEMRMFQAEMTGKGFPIDFSFMVRCLAGVATGSIALEGHFVRTPAAKLKSSWEEMKTAFERVITVLRQEAFIDQLDDLPTDYVLVPITVFVARQGGRFPTETVKRRFIRWLYLAGLWSRYSGATETKLQQDVALVAGRDLDPTPELEEAILRERGRVIVEATDLAGTGISSALGRFSYIVARANGARDWFTGIRLHDSTMSRSSGLYRHHVFAKSVLQKAGLSSDDDRRMINEVANRAFLVQKPDKTATTQAPGEYLPEVEETQPGALVAQSIPMDRTLWEPDAYSDFLGSRRQLLAQAMNDFIESWLPEAAEPVNDAAVQDLIKAGESSTLEFKASLRWDLEEGSVNKVLERANLKSIAGFLNSSEGGVLLVGVADDGAPVGLARDYDTLRRKDRDGFENHLRQLTSARFGADVSDFIRTTFHDLDGHDVCQVAVDPSNVPVYYDEGGGSTFYLRTGNATSALQINEAVRYIQRRWGGA